MGVAFRPLWVAAVADQARTSLGIDSSALCRLYQNDFDPVSSSDPSDFVEADFAGYTAKFLNTFGAPVNDGLTIMYTCNTLDWTVSGGPTTPQLIYGYWVDFAGLFMCGERFSGGPRVMNSAGQTLSLVLKVGTGFLTP